ncbi:hypothetical protein [Streptomyces sp. NPDC001415]
MDVAREGFALPRNAGQARAPLRQRGPARPRPGREPIFTALARQRESDSRLVLGRADEDWTILTRQYP